MKFFALILLTFLGVAHAYDVPPECAECAPARPESILRLTEPFARLQYLETKARNLDRTYSYLTHDLMPLARTLRDGRREATFEASMVEIMSIKADFDRLTQLQKETMIKEKQFNICLFNCGALRKVELRDDIDNLQKLKAILLMKRPVLANKAFEERLSKISDADLENNNPIPQNVFEQDLKTALFDVVGNLDKRKREYQKFLSDPNKPMIRTGNETFTAEYLENASSRFPEFMEDALRTSFHPLATAAEKTNACYFAQQFGRYSQNKRRVEIAIDVGLFVLPMMTGPIGLEIGMAARLAGWGLRAAEIRSFSTGATLALQSASVLKSRIDLNTLKNECSQKEIRVYLEGTQEKLHALNECNEQYAEQLFIANLSAIPAGLTVLQSVRLTAARSAFELRTVANTRQISEELSRGGLSNMRNGQGAIEFRTPDKGVFTVMDLSSRSARDPAMKNIPEEYWRYVGNVYNERLNLTPSEIDNFIKSSLEMSPRTTLILNTERSTMEGSLKIRGGVGIVTSRTNQELLPLEKATGVRIQKRPGEKIAEIVRLTVGKDGDPAELSTTLINQASTLLAADKSVNRVFVYTSKIHGRLYRRMGVPAGKIITLNDRDVLIELDRTDVANFLQNH